MKKIAKKTVLLVPLIIGTTLVLGGGAAEAATYNIHSDAEAWVQLGHEPLTAQDSSDVTRYFGKGSSNTLNLWANKMGACGTFAAGNGSGHTLNFYSGGNSLYLSGGTTSKNTANVSGGYAYRVCGALNEGNGSTNDNKVVISGGTVESLYGGYARGTGSANSNTVTIKGGNLGGKTLMGDVYAGRSHRGGASNNVLVVSGGDFNNSPTDGSILRGGGGWTAANGNTVDVSNFKGKISEIQGGYASGGSEVNASNNVVWVGNANGSYVGQIEGGLAYPASGGKATANNNKVLFLGGTINADIYGGRASGGSAAASNNTVEFRNNSIINGSAIYGGYSDTNSASVYGNTVVIQDNAKLLTSSIYGGRANNGTAERNTVYITGGTVKGNIYAGYGKIEKNNSIELYKISDLDLSGASLWGTNKIGDEVKSTNSTLNVYAAGIQVNDLRGFANLNYYLPDAVKNGDTILEVVGKNTTYLAHTTIGVSVPGGTNLNIGDQITLVYNKKGIWGPEEQVTAVRLTEGVSIDYDMELSMEEGNRRLVGTLTSGAYSGDGSVNLKEQTKSLVETRSAAMATLNNSIDMVTDKGFSAAKDAARTETGGGFAPFIYAGGNKMRYKTGSHVDSRGWGLAAGFAKEFKGKNHTLITGPFVEHGRSNYDSYLDNGVKADGKNRFTGGGWFVRNELKNGVNYEASIRFGHMNSDYNGRIGLATSYDSSSNYLGFHAGVGKTFGVGKKDDSLEVYGKYFYTHQNGTNATLSTGERYHFDAVNSSRIRLGARYTHPVKNTLLYAGLAWDYEFDSDARATYRGYSTPSPSMKGSSGMLELGVRYRPSPRAPFHMDFSLAGWAGKQRGVSFNAAFQWMF